jgi:hypothetical protein
MRICISNRIAGDNDGPDIHFENGWSLGLVSVPTVLMVKQGDRDGNRTGPQQSLPDEQVHTECCGDQRKRN